MRAIVAVDEVGHRLISSLNLVLDIASLLASALLAGKHTNVPVFIEVFNDNHRLVVRASAKHCSIIGLLSSLF